VLTLEEASMDQGINIDRALDTKEMSMMSLVPKEMMARSKARLQWR
jgi:hypothetical protein